MSDTSKISIHDAVRLAGTDPQRMQHAAENLQTLIFSIMGCAVMESTRPGKATVSLILHMYDGYGDLSKIMKRRAAGLFTDDDVHREVQSQKLMMHLITTTSIAFGIPRVEVAAFARTQTNKTLEQAFAALKKHYE